MIGSAYLLTRNLYVSGQDPPLDESCTHLALSGCYFQYTHVFWNNKLWPDYDGHLNRTAFHEVCSTFSERSSCHDKIAACPPIPGADFHLQEKGYQVLRDFVCNIPEFQDLQRAMHCVDSDKLQRCTAGPPPEPEEPPYDANGAFCRFAISGWVCREDAILPDCSIPIKRAKALFSTAREAVALLEGCGIKTSAASPLAPQGFFLSFLTLSTLRWVHGSL